MKYADSVLEMSESDELRCKALKARIRKSELAVKVLRDLITQENVFKLDDIVEYREIARRYR